MKLGVLKLKNSAEKTNSRGKVHFNLNAQYVPVLEPDLDHPHVESRVLTELLADVSRRLGTGVVG